MESDELEEGEGITKEELLRRLGEPERYEDGEIDKEGTHIKADEALIEFINDPEIKDAYEKIDKWYS